MEDTMRKHALTLAAICLAAVPAVADEAGQVAYEQYCATCHGPGGKGDGKLTEILSVPVPDLTQLSANNDGVFPMLYVIQTIDGRTGVRGHDLPMPVYGALFKERMSEIGPYAAEIALRGEILSIAYYLESIQQ
jgi:hypothetical protein